MTNEKRAERAFRAVHNSSYGDPSEGESVIYDLLCDLHHLADEYGYDWDLLTHMGEKHYAAEIEEATT